MYHTKRDRMVETTKQTNETTHFDLSKAITIGGANCRSILATGKYANIWATLKSQGTVTLCISNAYAKATIIRGVSQLKNLDTTWKFADETNYRKRIKVTEIKVANSLSHMLYLQLELVDSFKYRSNSL